jgi:hypothetical protein
MGMVLELELDPDQNQRHSAIPPVTLRFNQVSCSLEHYAGSNAATQLSGNSQNRLNLIPSPTNKTPEPEIEQIQRAKR